MPSPLDLRRQDLALAAFVLAVPTAATIFANALQSAPAWVRWLLMISWVLAAAFIVTDQVQRNKRSDESIDNFNSLTDTTRVRLKRQADDARAAAFDGFLKPDYWFPRKWNWTVYLYDEETHLLSPFWPASENPKAAALISFAPGNGATGQAWQQEETVVRSGSEVHDATHGLSLEQQEHFKDKLSVVATPIWANTRKIGVLAGIAADANRHFDAEKERSHLARTATILGTLITTLNTDT